MALRCCARSDGWSSDGIEANTSASGHPMSGEVMVAVCTLGKVRAEWALAFRGATLPTGRKQTTVLVEGFQTSHARNIACDVAIEKGYEYLFFWDDDVVPESQSGYMRIITDMTLQTGVTAISGVYPRRTEHPDPIVIEDEHGGVNWTWRDGKLHPIYVAGTGFMALRLSDLDAMDVPAYTTEDEREFRMFFNTHEEMTDDFWFGDLLKGQGKTWMVDGGVVCDQRDIEGRVYRIEDAVTEVASA